jgi:hypothetical protein
MNKCLSVTPKYDEYFSKEGKSFAFHSLGAATANNNFVYTNDQ